MPVCLNFGSLLEETWTKIHETIALSNDPKKSNHANLKETHQKILIPFLFV